MDRQLLQKTTGVWYDYYFEKFKTKPDFRGRIRADRLLERRQIKPEVVERLAERDKEAYLADQAIATAGWEQAK